MNAILLATARPAAIVLLAGLIKFLFDYQQDAHLMPAVIDGLLTTCLTAASFLGVNGAVSGARQARLSAPGTTQSED